MHPPRARKAAEAIVRHPPSVRLPRQGQRLFPPVAFHPSRRQEYHVARLRGRVGKWRARHAPWSFLGAVGNSHHEGREEHEVQKFDSFGHPQRPITRIFVFFESSWWKPSKWRFRIRPCGTEGSPLPQTKLFSQALVLICCRQPFTTRAYDKGRNNRACMPPRATLHAH
jgi:hypothetical protein